MDYRTFYAAIAEWIEHNQLKTAELGFGSLAYFQWVYQSAGELGNRFGNTPLVVKQVIFLIEWIEDAYKQQFPEGVKPQ